VLGYDSKQSKQSLPPRILVEETKINNDLLMYDLIYRYIIIIYQVLCKIKQNKGIKIGKGDGATLYRLIREILRK
jgi:hypothetical protein